MEPVPEHVRLTHWTEGPKMNGYGHKGLCCDCYDLAWMPLESVNRSRKNRGLEPLPASVETSAKRTS